MHLTHRPACPEDFPACSALCRGDRFYDPSLRAHRPAFWRDLYARESLLSVVVEDQDRPLETRLRAFSISMFAADAFVDAEKANGIPGVLGRLHAQALARSKPVLDRPTIARANAASDGLNLLIAGFGFAEALDDPAEGAAIIETMHACLYECHAGYRIKQFVVESYGKEWALQNMAIPLRVRDDYSSYFQDAPALPPAEHPILLGLTRDEAFAEVGNRYLPLFLYAVPRFGFRPAEQQLLVRALEGGSNAEIADALCVTPSAVKKRWEAIYARVGSITPSLLASSAGAFLMEKRGVEKKDRLLNYLRRHPQELRPYAPCPRSDAP